MQENKEETPAGILLIDKSADWTSHDVVNFVRRRFRIKKVGHCGTLDPFATGLLILLLGRSATKLQDKFMSEDKVYCGTIKFGIATDTQDLSGEIIKTCDTSELTEAKIEAALEKFQGKIKQIPPMFSAVKIDGKALYKLARKGLEVERKTREVLIHSFILDKINLSEASADFTVHCSKGTYVRTLAADLGERLNNAAHLQSLRRLQSGSFKVSQAYTIDEIKSWEPGQLQEKIIPTTNLTL